MVKIVNNENEIIGTITMADVKNHRIVIMLEDGTEMEAIFPPNQEEIVVSSLSKRERLEFNVTGITGYPSDKRKKIILEIKTLSPLSESKIYYDSMSKPIWDVFDEILKSVPKEDLDKLPSDAAEQHDHYIYGTSKKKA